MQPLWKTVWRFLKKLKTELTYDPAIPLLGLYSKKKKTLTRKGACTPMFTAALLTRVNTWKQTQCSSTDNWMCEYKYTHTMDYYSAIENSETLPFAATQMDQERLMLIK